jgi:purine-binding chemotaxis protein CheW
MQTQAMQTSAASGGLTESMQYLTFMLGKEVFALNILSVKEIIEYGQLTEVPKMPGFIRGVINLRGAVVPVIDLSARFDKGQAVISRKTCVVIVEVALEEGLHTVGVMVDAVNAVLDIEASQIEPPPSFGTHIRNDFIQGMGKVDERFIIILDANKVLSLDEIADVTSQNMGATQ